MPSAAIDPERKPLPPDSSSAGVEGESHASRRNRSIKSAIGTSFLSKAGTLLLQFAAMPIAAQVMGKEVFGLYASISMLLTMMIVMEFGMGPALAQGISRTAAADDRPGQSRFFTTGFLMLTGLALLAAAVLAVLISLVPLPVLFGEQYAGLEKLMLPALWLGIVAFAAQLILDSTVKVREGYLETNISNGYAAAGNLLSFVVIIVGIHQFPHAWFMILAVFGCASLVRLLNTLNLLKHRPHLKPRWKYFDRRTAGSLLVDGLAFSTAHTLPFLVEVNFSALVLGRTGGPGEVAIFLVFISIATMFGGLIIMITTPTWPAVVDAWAKGDRPWILKAARRLYGFTAIISLGLFGGMVLFGPALFPLWYGPEFQVDRVTCLLFSASCVLRAWRYANHALVVGIGKLRPSTAFTVIEVAFSIGFILIGAYLYGLAGVFAAQALAVLLFSGWGFPWLFWRSGVRDTAPATS